MFAKISNLFCVCLFPVGFFGFFHLRPQNAQLEETNVGMGWSEGT